MDASAQPHLQQGSGGPRDARRLRRVEQVVAGLNLGHFFVEFVVALAAGSVVLLADSVDFLEDTAVNLLIFVALGWQLRHRALMGKIMAVVILGPAALAAGRRCSGSPTRWHPRSSRID